MIVRLVTFCFVVFAGVAMAAGAGAFARALAGIHLTEDQVVDQPKMVALALLECNEQFQRCGKASCERDLNECVGKAGPYLNPEPTDRGIASTAQRAPVIRARPLLIKVDR